METLTPYPVAGKLQEPVGIVEIRDRQEERAMYIEVIDSFDARWTIELPQVLLYFALDESYRLRQWQKEYPDVTKKSIYQVRNSKLMRFVHRMSFNILDDFDIYHFGIYTEDRCIDILVTNPNFSIYQ